MVEEEFEEVSSSLNGNSVDIYDTEEKMARDFSGANNVGLLGSSADIIGEQMCSISNSIGNVNNIIKEHSKQFFSYDNYLVDKINEIVIPEDFLINNPLQINYYTQVILGKNDGESINEGEITQTIDDSFDSDVNAAVVRDISGSDTFEQKYDEGSSIASQENLYKLSEDSDALITKHDDMSNIEGETILYDINDGVSDYVVNTDDNTLTKEVKLNAASNNMGEDATINNYDDYYEEVYDNDNVKLNDINGYYEEVDYDEDNLDEE
jgi:hypothetical protein